MSTTIRDATVAFGAGYGTLLMVVQRRIAEYLRYNYYTLVGDTAPIALRATTQRALHTEIKRITTPFNLVLVDLFQETLDETMDVFLDCCRHLVSIVVTCRKVKVIGSSFLNKCSFLRSVDTSKMNAVTTIGLAFLANKCTALTSVDMSGMGVVTTIGSSFLAGCSSLTTLDTSGMRAVTSIDAPYFLFNCVSIIEVMFTTFGKELLSHNDNDDDVLDFRDTNNK